MEKQMNRKSLILAGFTTMVLSAGTALAGPCDTGGRAANTKDAGSGPTVPRNRRRCGVFAGCAKADAGPTHGGAAS